ncbi:hypothetical protein TSUD_143840 [Trifolium subterraneum]|uniref:Uncharacterized protein n=1 Tax=Trifolium subterraneum TaxID=3900 RepID=A0A2Z6MDX9_TRISU|nr:hypothetical protein TSUD_143840 [Trifolium subterraneum]
MKSKIDAINLYESSGYGGGGVYRPTNSCSARYGTNTSDENGRERQGLYISGTPVNHLFDGSP